MQRQTRAVQAIKKEGGGKDSDLSIIILGSKPNYRMRSFGPPSTIKDKNGKSILEHQITICQNEFNRNEIIVVGGFEIDKLAKNRPTKTRLVENQAFETSNEIGDIRLGINNAVYENLLIIFADMYFDETILKNLTQKSSLVVDDNNKLVEDDIGTTVVDNHVTILSMGIKTPKWAKIAYFTGLESKLLRQFVSNRDNDKLFMFEAINFILDKKGELFARGVDKNEFLVHVDNSRELGKI